MRLPILLLGFFLSSCSNSIEDHIETLASDPEHRESARQELLLARDQSVGPLLEALENPAYVEARSELVGSLLSLLLRIDDARIHQALSRHLINDPNPKVRARIARGFGLQRRVEGLNGLVHALQKDDNDEVRYQALLALGTLDNRLSQEQKRRVDDHARKLIDDPNPETRMEALIRIERALQVWLDEARHSELKAQLATAESLYAKTLSYFPQSKRGNYRLARFYYDNGRIQEGLQRLRQHGMLLDVPRFSQPPVIDGRLDDEVWSQAAEADTFYQLSFEHVAAVVSPLKSRLYLGYTDEALYIGFYGYDEKPEDLMVSAKNFDDNVWWEDVIEIFMDANFDHVSYAQVGITSVPVVADKWYPDGFSATVGNTDWSAGFEVATHVGQDYWSIEYGDH
jgi:hypothetical protein